MPVHGEYRMLAAHARLARDAGVPAERIPIAENGSVVELVGSHARIVDTVPAGITFVDGLALGDVRDASLRDRRHLAEDGVLIIVTTIAPQNGSEVAAPEVLARGFADPDEILDDAREEAEQVLRWCLSEGVGELKLIRSTSTTLSGELVYSRTGRRPMILPVVLEV